MSLCTTTFTRRWLKRRVGQTDAGWEYDCTCGANGFISKLAEQFAISHSEWAPPWSVAGLTSNANEVTCSACLGVPEAEGRS